MFKINRFALALVLTGLFIGLMGCGGGTTTTGNNSASNTTKPADTKPADTKPADTAEKIGVAECDEYIEKYEACIMSKVPEAQRQTFKSGLDQSRKAWKEAAANPQAKAALADGCKKALDAAKQSTTAFGCQW